MMGIRLEIKQAEFYLTYRYHREGPEFTGVLSSTPGEIRVRDVEGDVEVGSDGSGSIDVENVGGDFTVRSDGSEQLKVAEEDYIGSAHWSADGSSIYYLRWQESTAV